MKLQLCEKLKNNSCFMDWGVKNCDFLIFAIIICTLFTTFTIATDQPAKLCAGWFEPAGGAGGDRRAAEAAPPQHREWPF
jgi:hypothetical protein